jgi:hypothetical protein
MSARAGGPDVRQSPLAPAPSPVLPSVFGSVIHGLRFRLRFRLAPALRGVPPVAVPVTAFPALAVSVFVGIPHRTSF